MRRIRGRGFFVEGVYTRPRVDRDLGSMSGRRNCQYTQVAFSNDVLTVLTRIAASSSFMLFDVASISFSRLSLLFC